MVRLVSAVFTGGLLLALAGCGDGLKTQPDIVAGPVTVPFKFQVSSLSFLSERKFDIYQKLENDEAVAFGEITQAMVEDHWKYWVDMHKGVEENPELEDSIAELQTLNGPLPANMADAKVAIEARVAEKFPGNLLYNATARSYLDVLHTHKTQSYSGTMLMQFVLRDSLGKEAFDALNAVVIYESGHVLPGYVEYVVDANGVSVAHLVGVETTVSGRGRILYGPIKDLQPDRMLRIVDANLFALVELFKFDADDLVGLCNQVLKITADKYGIPHVPYLVADRFQREVDTIKIHWSPLGFGSPDTGRTDRERATFDEEPRSKLPRLNPNTTIYHVGDPALTPPPEAPKVVATELPKYEGEPEYPYREVVMADGKPSRLECWDYQKNAWVEMPYTRLTEDGAEDPDYYYVLEQPCLESKDNYPALPLPMKYRPEVRERDWGPYGGYGGEFDPDEDYYEDYP